MICTKQCSYRENLRTSPLHGRVTFRPGLLNATGLAQDISTNDSVWIDLPSNYAGHVSKISGLLPDIISKCASQQKKLVLFVHKALRDKMCQNSQARCFRGLNRVQACSCMFSKVIPEDKHLCIWFYVNSPNMCIPMCHKGVGCKDRALWQTYNREIVDWLIHQVVYSIVNVDSKDEVTDKAPEASHSRTNTSASSVHTPAGPLAANSPGGDPEASHSDVIGSTPAGSSPGWFTNRRFTSAGAQVPMFPVMSPEASDQIAKAVTLPQATQVSLPDQCPPDCTQQPSDSVGRPTGAEREPPYPIARPPGLIQPQQPSNK